MRVTIFAALALVCCILVPPQTLAQNNKRDLPSLTVTDQSDADATQSGDEKSKTKPSKWLPLLGKKGLDGWEVSDFGGDGKAERHGDSVVLEMGDPLNGITTTRKDFPTENYEIYLEAKRIEGNDFLCGLTFPVGKEFCTLIAGGWGGTLVGLSSIDGSDASENSTTAYHEFENGKWYKFRLRVDDENITAWIDGEKFFVHERDGHEFSTRIEVYASEPLGYCAFMSKVELRKFRWRPLKGTKTPASPSRKEKRRGPRIENAEKTIDASEPPIDG